MDSLVGILPGENWNATTAAFPQVCTHALFEEQVARSPEALAVVFGDRKMSYRELNARANKLAHHLCKRGVHRDVLVGVCLERTPEMVVALLAVWKAGGAYVPLDPAYPLERLAFMVEDSRPLLVLAEQGGPALSGVRSVCLDSDWPAIDQESDENPGPIAVPSDLAYVIYTSGSTGRPKGAMITHRGLVNYLWWAIDAYAVEAGCSVPVHSSLSFDLTVTSLYPPLLKGGSVELLAEDIGAEALLAALRRTGDRGLVKITPAHLALLNHQVSPADAAGMSRAFVIGGENLLAEHLALWRGLEYPPRLFNEYGPTETVVGCCVHEVRPEDAKSGPVAIGRPIANTQLYVLDLNLQPLPAGEMGELYIGGAGVARGYLNRPELTAERFISDPFGGDGQLYKTGDLARRRPDGTFEYLGRVDDQVKINGYRIELGEVEAAVAAQSSVQSCVVVAREDDRSGKRLVAYVVARELALPTADDLRTFVKTLLPDYMIPSRFVFLDTLPLTQNGKVDRKALPAPSRETCNGAKGRSPRSDTEKSIAAVWCDLLNRECISIDEDFFDLGDSLNAVQLVEQIGLIFGIEVSLPALFEHATIAQLSSFVDALILAGHQVGPIGAGALEEEFEP